MCSSMIPVLITKAAGCSAVLKLTLGLCLYRAVPRIKGQYVHKQGRGEVSPQRSSIRQAQWPSPFPIILVLTFPLGFPLPDLDLDEGGYRAPKLTL